MSVDWDYPHLSLKLCCLEVLSYKGEIKLNDHERVEWVDRERALETYDWAEADDYLLRQLLK